jgi:hypothetical protein
MTKLSIDSPVVQSSISALPADMQQKAADLITRITAVIEGIGDKPIVWRPPFLRLVQGTTDRATLPKGAGIGTMVLNEDILEGPLKFIPFRTWSSRQYWDPDQTNTRMLCQSPDALMGMNGVECKSCPHQVWKDGEGSDCNKTITMLAITADLNHIFTVTFSKTGYKVGMELNNLMTKAQCLPHERTYSLSTTTAKTAKNIEVFKVEALDAANRRTPKEVIPFVKMLADQFASDRKDFLTAFYENAKRRATTTATALEDSSEKPLAIADASSGDVQVKVDATAQDASISPMATRYTL